MARPMPTPLVHSEQMTLDELQRAMDEFVRSRGWYEETGGKPQSPRNLAASISLEASEILECFQWSDDVDEHEVGAELADVLLYVCQLANVLRIDLNRAVAGKLALNHSRWPAVEDEPWQQRLAS
jgi:NTP pyrophosphatase (non-canonical NTP hydrolase)